MERVETSLPGVFVLKPKVLGDERGWFFEGYNARDFAAAGIPQTFVQDNYSRSARNVLRGLHYQLAKPQAKLIRVLAGEVFDVAVDIRRGSPAFGRWEGVRLSSGNRWSVFVPEGFAHGFCVVSDFAEILYKVSDLWSPGDERGIAWNDPEIGIAWPLEGRAPILSARDRAFGTLATRAEGDLPRYAPT